MSYALNYPGLTFERVLEIIPDSEVEIYNLPDGLQIYWTEDLFQDIQVRCADQGHRCVVLWYGGDKNRSVLRVEKGVHTHVFNGQSEFYFRMKNAGIEEPWRD
jgi:urate oxidase